MVAVVISTHVLFWLVVAVRLMAPRDRHGPSPYQAARIRPPGASPLRQRLVLGLALSTMFAFYGLLALFWLDPALVGVRLLDPPRALQIGGAALSLLGVAICGWAYWTLPSFRVCARIDESHRLCRSGPYAIVRHPIYLGVILLYSGSFLILPHVGFLVQAVANALANRERARAEEEVLVAAFAGDYEQYMTRTGRLLPRL